MKFTELRPIKWNNQVTIFQRFDISNARVIAVANIVDSPVIGSRSNRNQIVGEKRFLPLLLTVSVWSGVKIPSAKIRDRAVFFWVETVVAIATFDRPAAAKNGLASIIVARKGGADTKSISTINSLARKFNASAGKGSAQAESVVVAVMNKNMIKSPILKSPEGSGNAMSYFCQFVFLFGLLRTDLLGLLNP